MFYWKRVDVDCRIQTYEHENLWSEAVCSYDLEMGQSNASDTQLNLLKVTRQV